MHYICVVLDIWREYCSFSYDDARQETDFYAQSLQHKLLLEQRMVEPDYGEVEKSSY